MKTGGSPGFPRADWAPGPLAATFGHSGWSHVRYIVGYGSAIVLLLWSVAIAIFSTRRIEYPKDWVIPLDRWLGDLLRWMVDEFDLGLFTFKELMRFFSWLLTGPFVVSKNLLVTGVALNAEGTATIPPLSWVGIIMAVTVFAAQVRGAKFSFFVFLGLFYLPLFGLWQSAMTTLASMVVAVPLGIVFGLILGIASFRSQTFATAINPILDLMQTIPVFAYLVPVLFLFGFGPVAALTATIVYALPPMVRITELSLKKVPTEILEAGMMAGCSSQQMLWKVFLPSARAGLMVGVNQVIMLSFTVVIIGSMIGAGGLGEDIITALQKLSIGRGLEAGIAITIMAIILDRISQAYAEALQTQTSKLDRPRLLRHPVILGFAILLVTTAISFYAVEFRKFPTSLQITTAPFWEDLVTWINLHWYDALTTIKFAVVKSVLAPVRVALLSLPWFGVLVAIGLLGYLLGGTRLCLLTGSLVFFLAATGHWEKSMLTVYLCGISVVLSLSLGIPLGILIAAKQRLRGIVHAIIDTLQTLPSFIYLIPVVMLFQNGDFAALIAIVAYSIVPSVRYTDYGIRMIPAGTIEAAKMMGASKTQILLKVQLPMALPEIVLGISQTIMMALSMLVITALVGTRDLGQEVLSSLQLADPGRGLVAGLCVACIAIVSDRIFAAWAAKLKTRYESAN